MRAGSLVLVANNDRAILAFEVDLDGSTMLCAVRLYVLDVVFIASWRIVLGGVVALMSASQTGFARYTRASCSAS